MRELYLFRHDLRLADNPGLLAHSRGDSLLCVFCWPGLPAWCNLTGMGAQRERFLRETLAALNSELEALGQRLLVLKTDPRVAVPQLVEAFDVDRVGTSASPGYYEALQVDEIRDRLRVPLDLHRGNSLFDPGQLPGEMAKLPRQFTPFRRKVENLAVSPPLPHIEQLPPPPAGLAVTAPEVDTTSPHPAFPVRGGSDEGRRRLERWMFERELVTSYRETRNYLEGIEGSSLMSPWLATGALSARQVAQALFQFESDRLRNESTAHLYMELLWREFFH